MTSSVDVSPLSDSEIAQALAEPMVEPSAEDIEAPYGRFQNGKPRKRPQRDTADRVTAPRKTPGRKPKPRNNYEELAGGLLQMLSLPLFMVAPMDGLAVAEHSPQIAKAVGLTAAERPEIASALDKLSTVGPYAILLGALLPPIVQVLVNHNVVPDAMAEKVGAKTKSQMQESLRATVAANGG